MCPYLYDEISVSCNQRCIFISLEITGTRLHLFRNLGDRQVTQVVPKSSRQVSALGAMVISGMWMWSQFPSTIGIPTYSKQFMAISWPFHCLINLFVPNEIYTLYALNSLCGIPSAVQTKHPKLQSPNKNYWLQELAYHPTSTQHNSFLRATQHPRNTHLGLITHLWDKL